MVGSLAFLQVESPAQWYSFGRPSGRSPYTYCDPMGSVTSEKIDEDARTGGRALTSPSSVISGIETVLLILAQRGGLQSRVTEVTERVHQAAGMSVADRALRAKVTGLFFGLLAHLEELNRLVREAI